MKRPSVLVFSGSDPSGGAGMQADVQAIAALGAHPLSVLTSLTVQDNDRVYAVHPVPATLLMQQAQVLIEKIEIAAVKIGIVGNRANAEAIAAIVQQLRQSRPDLPVVLDPVLASGHGDALGLDDAANTLAPLMALATLVTPNLPEATVLSGGDRRTDSQAEALLAQGCQHVLIKGGHAHDDKVVNRWFTAGEFRSWAWPRLAGAFHGSGCTLAAAIAALLANGKPMAEAIEDGQAYCHQALEHAYEIAAGQLIPSRPRPYMKAA
ncbi:bifunctional hydroxymethylpyrimidine kinase/phosphomethylpyrimidine kinase [Noviherbaspirillum sedimenti]|uniref:hydroxymethylpyrimidine kinase n=1 Tax=Noviherbaspirillum sedimenti TaxID=2320865 RepID=A0A3A3G168_9BURK|nr:hydroxymethylpyrimidine/phosphomethylpyrimidine kinase [Noviherbaspirillum sedimenti]RJG02218.1 hydroxymethylpyrimidine/phosphomethylpyrimidine kinase [Noviherbaspirillum sedimenti]